MDLYISRAYDIIHANKHVPGRTLVLDFDDTIVNTSFRDAFSPDMYHIPIPGMLELINHAKKLNYNIYIITARAPYALDLTHHNARRHEVPYDNIFTSLEYGQHPSFKTTMRKNLEKLTAEQAKKINSYNLFHYIPFENISVIPPFMFGSGPRLNVILTIGDQPGDVENCTHWGILIPTRMSRGYILKNGKFFE